MNESKKPKNENHSFTYFPPFSFSSSFLLILHLWVFLFLKIKRAKKSWLRFG